MINNVTTENINRLPSDIIVKILLNVSYLRSERKEIEVLSHKIISIINSVKLLTLFETECFRFNFRNSNFKIIICKSNRNTYMLNLYLIKYKYQKQILTRYMINFDNLTYSELFYLTNCNKNDIKFAKLLFNTIKTSLNLFEDYKIKFE